MLVDTNYSSAPIYNYLFQSGFNVYVVGGNPNDYLAKSVKNYINLDYSRVDLIRELIKKLNIDYIVPGCNDLSYKVCATLNSDGRYHGLDTLETTEIINSKDKFREFASNIGLPVPRMISHEAMNEKRPLIVKPVDAYSGRGMTVIHDPDEESLLLAIDRAKEFSLSKKCIIEEYVDGQLYSHTAIVINEKVVVDFIVEEHGTANSFVVDTSRVVHDFPLETLNRLRACIELLAKTLNLVDGLVHTQFIKRDEEFWLIEITRRCPGDLYSQLIELSTGFKYTEAYVKPFVKGSFSHSDRAAHPAWIMRHTVSQPSASLLGSIQFNFPVRIEKIVPLSLAGDMVNASPFGRIALIFLRTDSKEALDALFQDTIHRNLYAIQGA